MITIALASRDTRLIEQLSAAFKAVAPDLQVVPAEAPEALSAHVAACWFPPPGSLARLPHLQLVHSVAAGVDHLASDPQCPDLPVCRVVDPDHRRGMAEYVRWAVLHFHRDFDRVLSQQPSATWLRHAQRSAAQFRVGVMGLGSLGHAIAVELAGAGYRVSGWSRTAKAIAGVDSFSGDGQYGAFLQGLDLLVNLLPLTEATRGILGEATFAQLPAGAAIVNAGRGQHLDSEALIAALASGHLRGAVLDVFDREPLAADHPLWRTPGVVITPHMASAASHHCIAEQVAANARRLLRGEPLLNTVDLALGY